MINFPRSSFTWEAHPFEPDPHYRWPGGFVGEHGQVYHVRFTLEARCALRDSGGAELAELFLGAACRSEYTIASENLFQIPSGEWRMAFSRSSSPAIAERPSTETEAARARPLAEAFQNHTIDIRSYPASEAMEEAAAIAASTFAGDAQNARTVYLDEATGIEVELEYPIKVMNLNPADDQFQVCTRAADPSRPCDLGRRRPAPGLRRPRRLLAQRPGGVHSAAPGAGGPRGARLARGPPRPRPAGAPRSRQPASWLSAAAAPAPGLQRNLGSGRTQCGAASRLSPRAA